MHRNHLLKLLNSYTPTDEEVDAKNRTIEFVKTHENCFERSLTIGHITASAWLLNKTMDKSLLTHHMKLDDWFQLGGHCDGDADVLGVAIKEAQEESGILSIEPVIESIFDLDVHQIPANPRDAAHHHYDIRFLLRVTSDEEIQTNRESKELRWIGKDSKELPTHQRSVVRMFEKWLRISS